MQPASWAPLTAFAATLLAVWWLAGSRLSTRILDRPNPRSLHAAPVPRTGGIGLFAGILVAAGSIAPGLPPALWAALALAFAVSVIDDIRGVAVAWRLAVHVAACGLLAFALLQSEGPAAVATATLAATWMVNLYNFMDGADGLAGGMAAIGFSFYGVASWLAGDAAFALFAFSIAAAAAAFLVFNFPPARVFLGDAGSVPLGLLAAALGLIGWLRGHWSVWYPVLVFSPFIVDASVTLARRLLRMERVWEAHRDHYYQRLVRMGWGHRRTALSEYALMIACGTLGLAGLELSGPAQAALLAAVALGYAGLIAWIERGWSRFRETTGA